MKKKILTCLVAVFTLVAVNVCTGFKILPTAEEAQRYCGSGSFTDESETIYYAKKDTESYSINGDLPSYYRQSDLSGCANLAGSVVIGYYDRFCENLVPDYKTYVQFGSIIKYRMAGNEIQAVTETLYGLMGTDTATGGTTYSGFQKGMRAYVTDHGYSYSVEETNGLDYNKYKSAVENNKPVALFLNNYSLATSWKSGDGNEVINIQHSPVAHVVVGCGYKVDTYYNSDGQVVATRTYLKVASGLDFYGISYLCLDGKSKVDRASAIIIQ